MGGGLRGQEGKKESVEKKESKVHALMCTLRSFSICVTYQKYLLVVMSYFHSLFRALAPCPHSHCIFSSKSEYIKWLV